MTARRDALSYVDTAAPSLSSLTGLQRGATPQTVLNVVAPITDEEKRGARISCKRWAVANGGLAVADELIAMLGAQR